MATFKTNRNTFIDALSKELESISGIKDVNFSFDYTHWWHTAQAKDSIPIEYDERYIDTISLDNGLRIGMNVSWYSNPQGAKIQSTYLKGISIQFFHVNELICKAEWACEMPKETEYEHPQPHWHFIKRITSTTESVGPSPNGFINSVEDATKSTVIGRFGEDESVITPEQEAYNNSGFSTKRMHFAISSRWPDGREGNISDGELSRSKLFNWIRLCIISVMKQHDCRL